MMKLSIHERLLTKRTINKETNCWECTLKPITNGYCQLTTGPGKHKELVHRLAYSIYKDKTLEELKELKKNGIEILHSCDNRKCFNPEHLSLGTRKENIGDMISKGRQFIPKPYKTHCKRNHSLEDETNLYHYRGVRHCKQCYAVRQRERLARLKESCSQG